MYQTNNRSVHSTLSDTFHIAHISFPILVASSSSHNQVYVYRYVRDNDEDTIIDGNSDGNADDLHQGVWQQDFTLSTPGNGEVFDSILNAIQSHGFVMGCQISPGLCWGCRIYPGKCYIYRPIVRCEGTGAIECGNNGDFVPFRPGTEDMHKLSSPSFRVEWMLWQVLRPPVEMRRTQVGKRLHFGSSLNIVGRTLLIGSSRNEICGVQTSGIYVFMQSTLDKQFYFHQIVASRHQTELGNLLASVDENNWMTVVNEGGQRSIVLYSRENTAEEFQAVHMWHPGSNSIHRLLPMAFDGSVVMVVDGWGSILQTITYLGLHVYPPVEEPLHVMQLFELSEVWPPIEMPLDLDCQSDADSDGLCSDVDACDNDPFNDIDGDGLCGYCNVDADSDAVADCYQLIAMEEIIEAQTWYEGADYRSYIQGIRAEDFDKDGDFDVMVFGGPYHSDGYSKKSLLFENNGAEYGYSFAERSYLPGFAFVHGVSLADFDNDGQDDIVRGFWLTNAPSPGDDARGFSVFYRNKGPPSYGYEELGGKCRNYASPTDYPISFADIDNNGFVDVLIEDKIYLNGHCEDGGRVFLRNEIISETIPSINGQYTFQSSPFFDYNGDNYPDLFLTNADISGIIKPIVLVHNGDPEQVRYEAVPHATAEVDAGVSGGRIEFADLDNDGDLDLVATTARTASNLNERIAIYLLDENGVYTPSPLPEEVSAGLADGPRDVALCDLTRDGLIDAVVCDDSTTRIFVAMHNSSTQATVEPFLMEQSHAQTTLAGCRFVTCFDWDMVGFLCILFSRARSISELFDSSHYWESSTVQYHAILYHSSCCIAVCNGSFNSHSLQNRMAGTTCCS